MSEYANDFLKQYARVRISLGRGRARKVKDAEITNKTNDSEGLGGDQGHYVLCRFAPDEFKSKKQ
jgi:hypothetical protein